MDSMILDPKKVNWESILSGYDSKLGKPMDSLFLYLKDAEIKKDTKLSSIYDPTTLETLEFVEGTRDKEKMQYFYENIVLATQKKLRDSKLIQYTPTVYTTLLKLNEDIQFVYKFIDNPKSKKCELFNVEFKRRKPLFNFLNYDVVEIKNLLNTKRDGITSKKTYTVTQKTLIETE